MVLVWVWVWVWVLECGCFEEQPLRTCLLLVKCAFTSMPSQDLILIDLAHSCGPQEPIRWTAFGTNCSLDEVCVFNEAEEILISLHLLTRVFVGLGH